MKAYTVLKKPPRNKMIWGYDFHTRSWIPCVWAGDMRGECHVLRPWVYSGAEYTFTHWQE